MPEEYIMSSKACVYVLGGAANTASLFDFDGVYLLDGGFAEKSQGFVANVREVAAVLLSAPTLGNLGTTAALLGQDKPMPVFTNTKPLKSAKPGSSGELVKAIQDANSKLLRGPPPPFDPKYPANIIYQSDAKGVLSLYILAGDAKDAEVITKALASGNEAEVEKAAAEHGTVGILLWRPTLADKQAVRVLISGTCSMSRIQQSLDKAAKHLPFLNAPSVKSKDALTAIPPPAAVRAVAAGKPTSAKPAARPTTSGSRPPSANNTATAPRALTARAPAPARAAPSKPAPAAAKPAPAAARPAKPAVAPSKAPAKAPAKPAAPAKAPPPVKAAVPSRAAVPKLSEPVAQKKMVGKVQGAAPTKATAPVAKKAGSGATIPAAATTARVPAPSPPEPASDANVTIVLDDSLITPEDMNQGGLSHEAMDIFVIPPTPEPPRHDEVEEHKEEKKDAPSEEPKTEPVASTEPPKEIDDVANLADVEDEIPQPVDAFKKPEPTDDKSSDVVSSDVVSSDVVSSNVEDKVPEPVDAFKEPEPEPTPAYPTIGDALDDFDPLKPSHPEPSAPEVPKDHVIISTPDPNLPDIAAAAPFIPPSPRGHDNDGLIQLDDDLVKIAPGFEEPLIPQAVSQDGTLADCREELSKLVEISMDTDKSTEAGAELSQAIGDITKLSYEVQNLALDEKTDEYVRKLSSQMIEDATLPFTSALASSIVSSNGSQEHPGSNGHSSSNGVHDHQKELPKHDLMQSRSSVIENGAPVEYEKTDPALDDILNACAQESEKLDAANTPTNSEALHMPAVPGTAISAKPVKFSRPYYFDVVTVPRNEKLEVTVSADDLQEFISKIRSRNVILASKDISGEQLQGLLVGKQTWCDSAHPCTIIPTHSSPILVGFRQKNEDQFVTNHLTFALPVEKQRTLVNSETGAAEYELAKISLE